MLLISISSNTKPNGNLTSNESSIEATGNILVDSISTLTLNLEDSTIVTLVTVILILMVINYM